MSYDEDYDVTEKMIQSGGSFVSGLGKLWRLADGTNQAKLKAAFSEYWDKYRKMQAAEVARSHEA